jgi:hypothetical protein
MNGKGCGEKQSMPDLSHLSGMTEKNDENPQSG